MAETEEASVAVQAVQATPRKLSHFEDEAGTFKTVCRYFMNGRKCNRPYNCKFVHDKNLCTSYWKTGECKYAENCRKNHFVTVPDPSAKKEAATVLSGDEADKKPAKKTKEKKPKAEKVNGKDDDKPKVEKAKAEKVEKADKPKKEKKPAADKQDKPKTQDKTEKQEKEAAQDGDKKLKKNKKKYERTRPTKKNTESFEPMTKPVDLRITYDLGSKDDKFSTPLTSRDVVLVPNLFSDYKKGELYAKLMDELDNCGIPREKLLKMWHGNNKIDGTHLIVDDRSSWKAKCPTFDLITDRLQNFFGLSIKATRFNWYKDTSQWKPFHFDAAAVKPEIAAIQNFTVGISFGATRDAAFEHAETKTVISVPQPDGCVYAFARDTNVIWRHGILQDVPVREEGRISVIAWGWVDGMADVPSSPAAEES